MIGPQHSPLLPGVASRDTSCTILQLLIVPRLLLNQTDTPPHFTLPSPELSALSFSAPLSLPLG